MGKYLDKEGVETLWNKAKELNAQKQDRTSADLTTKAKGIVEAINETADAASAAQSKVEQLSNSIPKEHLTVSEAIANLAARVDVLEESRGLLGNATAGDLDVSQLTKCLYPVVMRAHGVPAEANVPENLPENLPEELPWDGVPAFVGQLYVNLDAASGGLYYAVGTDSVNDWKQA